MCVYAQFQNPKMRESLKCKSVLSRFLDPASMSSYMLAARRGYICIEMYEGSGSLAGPHFCRQNDAI